MVWFGKENNGKSKLAIWTIEYLLLKNSLQNVLYAKNVYIYLKKVWKVEKVKTFVEVNSEFKPLNP